KFERKGVIPERLQLQWISASEGREFAAKMREMDAIVKEYAASPRPTSGAAANGAHEESATGEEVSV
ncbi:MAG TPA: hydrogenase iron-sulfur subunit, partial [Dehalococcoidia bacterium]|nr:hydrogenase iron-sulfur subunit [Dehalococcoidia bacterium]